jgi:translation initiation factor IF-3
LKNEEILKFDQVRVIDETAKNLGVLNSKAALSLAESKGLDLVVVNEKINPPICKIMDFGKLAYEKKKQQKENAKKSRMNEEDLKIIQMTTHIAEHDMSVKENQIRKFLDRGDAVQIQIRMLGREAYSDLHRERTKEFLETFLSKFENISRSKLDDSVKKISITIRKEKDSKNEKS